MGRGRGMGVESLDDLKKKKKSKKGLPPWWMEKEEEEEERDTIGGPGRRGKCGNLKRIGDGERKRGGCGAVCRTQSQPNHLHTDLRVAHKVNLTTYIPT